jgi:hypothetical protein
VSRLLAGDLRVFLEQRHAAITPLQKPPGSREANQSTTDDDDACVPFRA